MPSSEMDPFRELADHAGLAREDSVPVEPLTPLLANGGSLEPGLRGKLPGGAEGLLGRYRYVDTQGDGGGTFTFTVAVTSVPESTPFAPRVFCVDKDRITSNTHYGFEIRTGRLWTESAKLNERYEVTVSPYQDDNWLRQLFSPTFIDYLAEVQLEEFCFELAFGAVCTSIDVDDPDRSTLEALGSAASEVTKRISEEARE